MNLKNHFLTLLICLMSALFTGCAHQQGKSFGGITSYDGVSALYPADAQSLGISAGLELARRYPPARTGLGIVKAPGAFGEALENTLRGQGFAVMPLESSALRFGYVLDMLAGEAMPTCYVQLRGSDEARFGYVRGVSDSVPVPMPSGGSAALPKPEFFSEDLSEENSELLTKTVPDQRPTVPAKVQTPSATPVLTSAVPMLPLDTRKGAIQLSAGVLNTLPAHWKYTIPDPALRPIRVYPLKGQHTWREQIEGMTRQASARPVFDEQARRVTVLKASPAVPAAPAPAQVRVQAELVSPKATISVTPVSAPVPAVSVAASSSTPKPETLPTEDMSAVPTSAPAPTPSASTPELSSDTPSSSIQSWELMPGSLKSQLTEWASRAGYQLVWKSSSDLDMEAHSRFRGSFLEAMQALFTGLHRSGQPLRVTIYQDNQVLEVSEK